MGLTKVAITRPIFMLMLMVAAIMLGTIGYRSMRVEQNPDVNFGAITVTTVYPGAGPDEVNTLVSRKVEEAVSSVANLIEVTSTSQEGVSIVSLQFDVGSDMDAALNEVRSKVDSAVGRLPTDAEKPIVDKFDTGSDPVLNMIVRSDRLSNRQLRDLAENAIKDRLARVTGVASVGVSGGDLREIQVQVKRDALLRYGIGILDVQQAVQRASLNIPSGRVVSGNEEFTVRVLGEYKTLKDIEDIFISISGNGPDGERKSVSLRDVARIVDANAERRTSSRLNGTESVVVVVQKAKDGNAVQISKAILEPGFSGKSLLETMEEQYGVQFVVSFNAAEGIEESLFDLQFALGFGIVLVMLVVWLFLHNLRGTMIVAVAIPICLFGTLIVLWAAGFTINTMSMLALSLAIGVLVDDAIVVIENIYRHLRMGEDPVDAAINGRAEIGLAAIAITLADVVVFVPIAFMGGVVGQFFKPLGIGFAVTVLISLFVSFTFTPMMASRWYRKGEDWEHPTGRFAAWFERSFNNLALRYRRVLEWSLHHRWFVFVTGFTVLVALFMFIGGSFAQDPGGAIQAGTGPLMMATIIGFIVFVGNIFRGYVKPRFILYGFLFGLAFPMGALVGYGYAQWKNDTVFKFAFFPPNDGGQVNIGIELPPGASLAATTAVVERVEKIVMQHPEAEYTLANVGRRGGGFGPGSQGTNYAEIRVTLHDKKALLDSIIFWKKHDEKLRTVASNSVAADLLEQIGRVPGAKVTVTAGDGFGFGPAIQMSFRSDDREKLLASAVRIRDGLARGAVDGVISPELSSKPGKPELRAIPNRAKLGDLGITTAEVGASLRTLYEGDEQTKFRVLGQEYDVRVMLDLEDRNNPDLLASIPITFREGQPIYLSEVATIERGQGVDKIDRRDRTEEIQVTADLLPGKAAGSVQQEINNWMTRENLLAEGVAFRPLGQADIQARESAYLFGALMLGLVLVYMLLASLYDNLLYPFIIQLAQPQAMIGALLALILTDKTLNIVGFIGIIALVGLVGKNAILLVDYTNTLRDRGKERFQALVESGQTRLRPIMMTTMALIVGMLPVALAIGRGSEFRETIGITIIGGVLLSTLLTLLVIPCSYSIFDDIANSFGKTMRKFRKGSQPAMADGPGQNGAIGDPKPGAPEVSEPIG